MSETYNVLVPSQWSRYYLRRELALADYPGRDMVWLTALAKRYKAHVTRTLSEATGGEKLVAQGILNNFIRFGQTQEGYWLCLATYERHRRGKLTRCYALFSGSSAPSVVEQGKEWRKQMALDGREYQRKVSNGRVSSARPVDYFQGERLPNGITVRELAMSPGLYSISLYVRGRSVSTVRIHEADVPAWVDKLVIQRDAHADYPALSR